MSKLFLLARPACQFTPLCSVLEEISPRAPALPQRVTFPWAHPLLPPATASTIWFNPSHKVPSSCQEPRHQKHNPRTCVFNILLNRRMTLLILVLVKSFDIHGKNMLFKHHQAFAIPALQQVPNCLLSPALFFRWLKIRHTFTISAFTLPQNPVWWLFAPCFYMQTLVTAISDLTTEMTQKPGNIDKSGQKPRTDLHLLPRHLPAVAWVTPAASKTDWKPNTWHYLLWCTGVVILTLRLLSSSTRVGWCNTKVMLSRSRDAVFLLAKLRAFPCDCSGIYKPWPHSWEHSYCSPPSSINTKMKGLIRKQKFRFSYLF